MQRTIIQNLNSMESSSITLNHLTATNFRNEMSRVFAPQKAEISAAAANFHKKYQEYKKKQFQKRGSYRFRTMVPTHQKTPSLFSDFSGENQMLQEEENDPVISQNFVKNVSYDLEEWEPSINHGCKNVEFLQRCYQDLFSKKMKISQNEDYSRYDFKLDEKAILVNIFDELKGQDNFVTFEAVIDFFSACKLYYLCYNIRPVELEDLIKDSAHERNDRLNLTQFLNIFYIDRPTVLQYSQNDFELIKKRCVLSEESWKDFKTIFNTLDTFGNETIYMTPFINKIKNNLSNRRLLDEPAIQYPELGRTFSIKKVIFNIQYRYKIQHKIQWKDLVGIFQNYEHKMQPTIDNLFKKMIKRGQISKFSNNFMLSEAILQQIKHLYYRSPKYCDFFIKTTYICKQLLDSHRLKKHLKEAIVRIVEEGLLQKYVRLEDQIRIIMNEAEAFLDLDQLLEYFSIKGPSNGKGIYEEEQESKSSDEENEARIVQKQKQKLVHKLKKWTKDPKKAYKSVRHLTVCEQFNLSKKKGPGIMQQKTQMMRLQQQAAVQRELQVRFKANPIPVQLNPERYKAYQHKIEEQNQHKRRQKQLKDAEYTKVYQYLKANTKLFEKKQQSAPKEKQSNLNRSFTPKPLPWFVTQMHMLQKIEQKNAIRRKKISMQVKTRILKQWKELPEVAQEYSQPSALQSQNQEQEKPMQVKKNKSKVKEVPNFKELQREFAESLQKKKQTRKPTVPIQFKFTPAQRKDPQELKQTKKLSKVASQPHLKKSESPAHKASVQTCLMHERPNISTTLKFQQMVKHNYQKIQQQKEAEAKLLKEQHERKQKQEHFAKFMHKKLKESLHKSPSVHSMTTAKTRKLKTQWTHLQKENQENLCEMYFRVMNRPFLFENSNNSAVMEGNTNKSGAKLKKKAIKGKKSPNVTSKHIHQSPLKAYEADVYEDSSKRPQQGFRFEPCFEEQSPAPVLNQSF